MERTYVIQNQSDYHITIKFYYGNLVVEDQFVYEVELEKLVGEYVVDFEEDHRSGVSPAEPLNGNSAEIIFNMEKVIFSAEDEPDINFLFSNEYYYIKGDTYTYTFTNEDYDRAEPITP